jgi:hypothetical protein
MIRQLQKQKADVWVLDLPLVDGVNGPDDYIGIKGDAAMLELLDRAKPPNHAINIDELERADMPDSVLDGHLGEICQNHMKSSCLAYAWPSIVTIAGASPWLKIDGEGLRANLFTCLVGDVDSGKSATFERALALLGMGPSDSTLLAAKFGSGEALMQRIGSGSCVRLLYPDELKHLLMKSGIEHASFPTLLTTAFYNDKQKGGTKNPKEQFEIDCRLSVAGGLVESDFGDCFGSASTSGLYDRFVFGLSPLPYQYLYRPTSRLPIELSPKPPEVSACVFDERDQWIKDGIKPRVAELCLRMAYICAAVDRRNELLASDLGPALAMAKYQTKVRRVLQPNPGLNHDAQCAIKIRNWLEQHPGKWVDRRTLSRAIHANRFGPGVLNRAILNLAVAEEIEIDAKQKLLRLSPV